MTLRSLNAAFLAVALAAAAPRADATDSWTRDLDAAKAAAAADDKDLLLFFTGSDWCVWCLKLEGEVFQADPFPETVLESFVPVTLDYPRDKELVTDEERAQNERLKDEFSISGYPTVILADAEGRPYAKTGYQEGGPESYLTHLAELTAGRERRDVAFARADSATGVERARLLHEALSTVPAALRAPFYLPVMKEIAALDANGLAKEYRRHLEGASLERVLAEVTARAESKTTARDWSALVDEMADVVKNSNDEPEVVHLAMLHMGVGYLEQARLQEGMLCLREGLDADPDGAHAAEMRRMIREASRQFDG